MQTIPVPSTSDRSATDQHDYSRFLAENGFSEEHVLAVVQNESDQVPMPTGTSKAREGPSRISGTGLLATSDLQPGEVIAPALVGGMRKPAGRYTNHSAKPNAKMVATPDGDCHLTARHRIRSGDEVLIDYRQANSVNRWPVRPDHAETGITIRQRLQAEHLRSGTAALASAEVGVVLLALKGAATAAHGAPGPVSLGVSGTHHDSLETGATPGEQ